MIEIIFLDVDGCLSDGGLWHTNLSDEAKRFDVKDGFGIVGWLSLGKKVAIITGKSSKIVENRAKELGIKRVYQGVKDKLKVAKEILQEEGLDFSKAAAIGDDYNDAKLLGAVAKSFKPNDAMSDLNVDVVLQKCGGKGAVREMIEILIRENGQEQEWLKRWF
ncbi:HAD family hydrolase [uncultured Campylobacter sp.]|uniref:KdsC family phosphatase n=1 Tax=uncultured Campylobacter sp. TaxID=218934 RepID=UPI0026350696|nr:HAD family hydrolase [uncultured Campylobacter sp.]